MGKARRTDRASIVGAGIWRWTASAVLSCGLASGCTEPGNSVFAGAGGAGGGDASGGSVGSGGAGASQGGEAGVASSGQGGSQGGEGGGYEGPNTIVTNNDSTCAKYTGWPSDQEMNHLFAARLTPPSHPFVVEFVRYTLATEFPDSCDNGLAHSVDIFVAGTSAPPATPVVAAHIDVPATASTDDLERVILLELETPLTVQPGEDVFVAVRMAGTPFGPRICVRTCAGPAYQEDRNYDSGAVAPPYPWYTLGIAAANYDFEAIGHPP